MQVAYVYLSRPPFYFFLIWGGGEQMDVGWPSRRHVSEHESNQSTSLYGRRKKKEKKNPASRWVLCVFSEPQHAEEALSQSVRKRCVSEPHSIVIMNIDPVSALFERHRHKRMSACMNFEGDVAHVYLLKLSDGSRVLQRYLRSRILFIIIIILGSRKYLCSNMKFFWDINNPGIQIY